MYVPYVYNVIVYITWTFSFNILGNIRDFNMGKVMYNGIGIPCTFISMPVFRNIGTFTTF